MDWPRSDGWVTSALSLGVCSSINKVVFRSACSLRNPSSEHAAENRCRLRIVPKGSFFSHLPRVALETPLAMLARKLFRTEALCGKS
jgi:hypothetical protein